MSTYIKIFKVYYGFIALIVLVTLFCPVNAKEKYIYENGYLADIQVSQGYEALGGLCSKDGCTPGYGSSYDVFYPVIKVGGIAYVGKTESRLQDWIVGQRVKVRFNKKKTKIYLKREGLWDFGIEVVKRVKE